MRIERAHLYIEKYSKQSHELLLDFVREDEFIFFRNRGDYTPNMHLQMNQFEPTMLLIHDCVPTQKMQEGNMLTVAMDKLIELASAVWFADYDSQESIQSRAAMLFLEVDDGSEFAKLIDNEETIITHDIPNDLYYHLEPSWKGSPCALERLENEYELRIWDVGQGSTNSISDRDGLTLFDFGASIHYSKQRREAIIRKHDSLLRGQKQISLVISHWDCDHINLLCEVEDAFMQRICCVFYPPGILSLTAKQIAMRIRRNCRYRVEIHPRARVVWNKCGIQRVHIGNTYILYTGETSTDQNQSGLLLAVSSKNTMALLTADHTNYQVWNIMFKDVAAQDKCLHVVGPHHGGNCGRTAVRTVTFPGKAVVSVGSNAYGHPAPASVMAYRRARYRLVRTDITGDDVVILMK